MLKRIFQLLLPACLFLSLYSPAAYAADPRSMIAAGHVDEAIAALQGRLSSSPRDAESFNLLCRAYYSLEDYSRAQQPCEKAIALEPNNASYHLWMGRVYGGRADHANVLVAANMAGKTRDELERAVALDPKDVDARLDLSEYYIEAPSIMGGGHDKAIAQAKLIGMQSPDREHWVYARIAEKKKDATTAEREYRQVVALSHGDAESWLNLALFLRRQNRYDEMEQAIAKLSEAPMPRLDALVDGASVLYKTDRNFPFAIQLLKRYLATGPIEEAPAFKAHYLLGNLLEKQGDKAGAAQQYRASLALARNFGLAQQALNRVTP
jgi:tetratricopeptide (TPR) repeat protein